MPTTSYKSFRIVVADGWSAQEANDSTTEFLRITPSAHTAELRLTTCDPARMSAKGWVDFMAHTYRMMNRQVSTAKFGPLAGYEVQFIAGDTWVRGWVLEYCGIPLDICYRCDVSLLGCDDANVDAMLQSLQMEPVTEQAMDVNRPSALLPHFNLSLDQPCATNSIMAANPGRKPNRSSSRQMHTTAGRAFGTWRDTQTAGFTKPH